MDVVRKGRRLSLVTMLFKSVTQHHACGEVTKLIKKLRAESTEGMLEMFCTNGHILGSASNILQALIVTGYGDETITMLLNCLDVTQRSELIMMPNSQHRTAIHTAMEHRCNEPQLLLLLLNNIVPEKLPQLFQNSATLCGIDDLMLKFLNSDSVLSPAADSVYSQTSISFDQINSFAQDMLSNMSEEKRFNILQCLLDPNLLTESEYPAILNAVLIEFSLNSISSNHRMRLLQAINDYGDTMLTYAMATQRNDLVVLMLNSVSDQYRVELLLPPGCTGISPMKNAVREQRLDFVKLLLSSLSEEQRVELLCTKDHFNETILADAIKTKRTDLIKLLLNSVSNIHRGDLLRLAKLSDGETTLTSVTKQCNYDLLKLFRESVEDHDWIELVEEKNHHGNSALTCAIMKQNSDCIDLLLGSISEELRGELLLRDRNRSGDTALAYTICQNNRVLLKKLLNFVNEEDRVGLLQAKNQDGNTAVAIAMHNKTQRLDLLELLLHSVAEQQRFELQRTINVLITSVISNNLDLFATLLNSVDEDHQIELLQNNDSSGNTAITCAIMEQRVDILEWLFSDISEEDASKLLLQSRPWDGETALTYVIIQRNDHLLDHFLCSVDHGHRMQLLRLKNHHGNTPLTCAIMMQKTETIALILDSVSIECRGQLLLWDKHRNGDTAITYTVKQCNMVLLKTLLNFVSERYRVKLLRSKNKDNESAFTCAIKERDVDLLELLLYSVNKKYWRFVLQDARCHEGHTALTTAILGQRLNLLKLILENVDTKVKVQLLQMEASSDMSALSCAIATHRFDLVAAILEDLDDDIKCGLLVEGAYSDEEVSWMVEKEGLMVFELLLTSFNERHRAELLKRGLVHSLYRHALRDSIIKNPDPKMVNILLKWASQAQSKTLLQEACENEGAVLQLAICSHNCKLLMKVLDSYDEDTRFELLLSRAKEGRVTFAVAIDKEIEVMKQERSPTNNMVLIILHSICEENRLKLLTAPDRGCDNLATKILVSEDGPLVEMMLRCLQVSQRLNLLQQRNRVGDTLLHTATSLENFPVAALTQLLDSLIEQNHLRSELSDTIYETVSKEQIIQHKPRLLPDSLEDPYKEHDDHCEYEIIQPETCTPDLPGQVEGLPHLSSNSSADELLVRDCNPAIQVHEKERFHDLIVTRNYDGQTILHKAIKRNYPLIRAILGYCNTETRRELIMAQDGSHKSPLIISAQRGYRRSIQLLIQSIKPADKIATDSHGFTLVHCSLMHSDEFGIFTINLLDTDTLRSITTIQDSDGNTPLHLACHLKRRKSLEALLKCCQSASHPRLLYELKNNYGKSAVDLCYDEHQVQYKFYVGYQVRSDETDPLIHLAEDFLHGRDRCRKDSTAVIMCNTKNRQGWDAEESTIKSALQRHCHEVKSVPDLTVQVIESVIREEANDLDSGRILWFFIGSHGTDGDLLLDHEGSTVELSTLVNAASETSEARHKLKVFLIECCRGNPVSRVKLRMTKRELASGMEISKENCIKGLRGLYHAQKVCSTADTTPDEQHHWQVRFSLSAPNTLVLLSTHPGFPAKRGLMAEALRDTFGEADDSISLPDLLTRASHLIMEKSGQKQMPVIQSSLTDVISLKTLRQSVLTAGMVEEDSDEE